MPKEKVDGDTRLRHELSFGGPFTPRLELPV